MFLYNDINPCDMLGINATKLIAVILSSEKDDVSYERKLNQVIREGRFLAITSVELYAYGKEMASLFETDKREFERKILSLLKLNNIAFYVEVGLYIEQYKTDPKNLFIKDVMRDHMKYNSYEDNIREKIKLWDTLCFDLHNYAAIAEQMIRAQLR